jgi:predicted  nucleic acid-binding Zn ribbon protein
MLNQSDPYWKLRPPPPTPADEICTCAGCPPIMLQPCLSFNPVACLLCNLEVLPERIGFSEELADKLARWQSFYDCFYQLWLSSDEFELWAQAQLEDPQSSVNQQGLALVLDLNNFRRAYYWWFQAAEDDDSKTSSHCPICHVPLSEYVSERNVPQRDRWVCERCCIVMPRYS